MKMMMTGSRNFPTTKQITNVIREELQTHSPEMMYFGGARGADATALKVASSIELDTTLVAVVPWTVEDQPAEAVSIIREHADQVEELRRDTPVELEGIPLDDLDDRVVRELRYADSIYRIDHETLSFWLTFPAQKAISIRPDLPLVLPFDDWRHGFAIYPEDFHDSFTETIPEYSN